MSIHKTPEHDPQRQENVPRYTAVDMQAEVVKIREARERKQNPQGMKPKKQTTPNQKIQGLGIKPTHHLPSTGYTAVDVQAEGAKIREARERRQRREENQSKEKKDQSRVTPINIANKTVKKQRGNYEAKMQVLQAKAKKEATETLKHELTQYVLKNASQFTKPDPPFKFRFSIGLTLSFGGPKGQRVNYDLSGVVSIGFKQGNFMGNVNAGASMSYGNLGSTKHYGRSQGNLFLGGLATVGTIPKEGKGTGTHLLETLDRRSISPILNDYQLSLSAGTNALWNSKGFSNKSTYAGFKTGNFSMNVSNDVLHGTDHYNGANISMHFGDYYGRFYGIGRSDMFNGPRYLSGHPTKDATPNFAKDKKGRIIEKGEEGYDEATKYVAKQSEFQRQLNSGQTTFMINLRNFQNSGHDLQVGVGGIGGLHSLPQRLMHYGFDWDQFIQNIQENHLQFLIGIRRSLTLEPLN